MYAVGCEKVEALIPFSVQTLKKKRKRRTIVLKLKSIGLLVWFLFSEMECLIV
jgi:hypothetical protein